MIHGLSNVMRLPRAGKVRIGRRRPRKGDDVLWRPPDTIKETQGKVEAGATSRGGMVKVKLKGESKVRQVPEEELKVIGLGGTPEKLDHFVLDPYNRELLPILTEALGEKPRSLPVMFPLDDTHPWETIFPQYLKRYKHGPGLVCKGDGRVATQPTDTAGVLAEVECNPGTCPEYQAGKCKRVASLQFMLRVPSLQSLAVWQIDTGGIHSIININSRLALFKAMDTFGKNISGIPLRLSVGPREVHPDGKRRIVYVLDLDLDHEAELGVNVYASRFLPGADAVRLIEGPVEIEPPDEDEVPGELFADPETVTVLTASYEELPEDIRKGAEILGWPQTRLMAELQRYADGEGALNVEEAKAFLSQEVDAEIARREGYAKGATEEPPEAEKDAESNPLGL